MQAVFCDGHLRRDVAPGKAAGAEFVVETVQGEGSRVKSRAPDGLILRLYPADTVILSAWPFKVLK